MGTWTPKGHIAWLAATYVTDDPIVVVAKSIYKRLGCLPWRVGRPARALEYDLFMVGLPTIACFYISLL